MDDLGPPYVLNDYGNGTLHRVYVGRVHINQATGKRSDVMPPPGEPYWRDDAKGKPVFFANAIPTEFGRYYL